MSPKPIETINLDLSGLGISSQVQEQLHEIIFGEGGVNDQIDWFSDFEENEAFCLTVAEFAEYHQVASAERQQLEQKQAKLKKQATQENVAEIDLSPNSGHSNEFTLKFRQHAANFKNPSFWLFIRDRKLVAILTSYINQCNRQDIEVSPAVMEKQKVLSEALRKAKSEAGLDLSTLPWSFNKKGYQSPMGDYVLALRDADNNSVGELAVFPSDIVEKSCDFLTTLDRVEKAYVETKITVGDVDYSYLPARFSTIATDYLLPSNDGERFVAQLEEKIPVVLPLLDSLTRHLINCENQLAGVAKNSGNNAKIEEVLTVLKDRKNQIAIKKLELFSSLFKRIRQSADLHDDDTMFQTYASLAKMGVVEYLNFTLSPDDAMRSYQSAQVSELTAVQPRASLNPVLIQQFLRQLNKFVDQLQQEGTEEGNKQANGILQEAKKIQEGLLAHLFKQLPEEYARVVGCEENKNNELAHALMFNPTLWFVVDRFESQLEAVVSDLRKDGLRCFGDGHLSSLERLPQLLDGAFDELNALEKNLSSNKALDNFWKVLTWLPTQVNRATLQQAELVAELRKLDKDTLNQWIGEIKVKLNNLKAQLDKRYQQIKSLESVTKFVKDALQQFAQLQKVSGKQLSEKFLQLQKQLKNLQQFSGVRVDVVSAIRELSLANPNLFFVGEKSSSVAAEFLITQCLTKEQKLALIDLTLLRNGKCPTRLTTELHTQCACLFADSAEAARKCISNLIKKNISTRLVGVEVSSDQFTFLRFYDADTKVSDLGMSPQGAGEETTKLLKAQSYEVLNKLLIAKKQHGEIVGSIKASVISFLGGQLKSQGVLLTKKIADTLLALEAFKDDAEFKAQVEDTLFEPSKYSKIDFIRASLNSVLNGKYSGPSETKLLSQGQVCLAQLKGKVILSKEDAINFLQALLGTEAEISKNRSKADFLQEIRDKRNDLMVQLVKFQPENTDVFNLLSNILEYEVEANKRLVMRTDAARFGQDGQVNRIKNACLAVVRGEATEASLMAVLNGVAKELSKDKGLLAKKVLPVVALFQRNVLAKIKLYLFVQSEKPADASVFFDDVTKALNANKASLRDFFSTHDDLNMLFESIRVHVDSAHLRGQEDKLITAMFAKTDTAVVANMHADFMSRLIRLDVIDGMVAKVSVWLEPESAAIDLAKELEKGFNVAVIRGDHGHITALTQKVITALDSSSKLFTPNGIEVVAQYRVWLISKNAQQSLKDFDNWFDAKILDQLRACKDSKQFNACLDSLENFTLVSDRLKSNPLKDAVESLLIEHASKEEANKAGLIFSVAVADCIARPASINSLLEIDSKVIEELATFSEAADLHDLLQEIHKLNTHFASVKAACPIKDVITAIQKIFAGKRLSSDYKANLQVVADYQTVRQVQQFVANSSQQQVINSVELQELVANLPENYKTNYSDYWKSLTQILFQSERCEEGQSIINHFGDAEDKARLATVIAANAFARKYQGATDLLAVARAVGPNLVAELTAITTSAYSSLRQAVSLQAKAQMQQLLQDKQRWSQDLLLAKKLYQSVCKNDLQQDIANVVAVSMKNLQDAFIQVLNSLLQGTEVDKKVLESLAVDAHMVWVFGDQDQQQVVRRMRNIVFSTYLREMLNVINSSATDINNLKQTRFGNAASYVLAVGDVDQDKFNSAAALKELEAYRQADLAAVARDIKLPIIEEQLKATGYELGIQADVLACLAQFLDDYQQTRLQLEQAGVSKLALNSLNIAGLFNAIAGAQNNVLTGDFAATEVALAQVTNEVFEAKQSARTALVDALIANGDVCKFLASSPALSKKEMLENGVAKIATADTQALRENLLGITDDATFTWHVKKALEKAVGTNIQLEKINDDGLLAWVRQVLGWNLPQELVQLFFAYEFFVGVANTLNIEAMSLRNIISDVSDVLTTTNSPTVLLLLQRQAHVAHEWYRFEKSTLTKKDAQPVDIERQVAAICIDARKAGKTPTHLIKHWAVYLRETGTQFISNPDKLKRITALQGIFKELAQFEDGKLLPVVAEGMLKSYSFVKYAEILKKLIVGKFDEISADDFKEVEVADADFAFILTSGQVHALAGQVEKLTSIDDVASSELKAALEKVLACSQKLSDVLGEGSNAKITVEVKNGTKNALAELKAAMQVYHVTRQLEQRILDNNVPDNSGFKKYADSINPTALVAFIERLLRDNFSKLNEGSLPKDLDRGNKEKLISGIVGWLGKEPKASQAAKNLPDFAAGLRRSVRFHTSLKDIFQALQSQNYSAFEKALGLLKVESAFVLFANEQTSALLDTAEKSDKPLVREFASMVRAFLSQHAKSLHAVQLTNFNDVKRTVTSSVVAGLKCEMEMKAMIAGGILSPSIFKQDYLSYLKGMRSEVSSSFIAASEEFIKQCCAQDKYDLLKAVYSDKDIAGELERSPSGKKLKSLAQGSLKSYQVWQKLRSVVTEDQTYFELNVEAFVEFASKNLSLFAPGEQFVLASNWSEKLVAKIQDNVIAPTAKDVLAKILEDTTLSANDKLKSLAKFFDAYLKLQKLHEQAQVVLQGESAAQQEPVVGSIYVTPDKRKSTAYEQKTVLTPAKEFIDSLGTTNVDISKIFPGFEKHADLQAAVKRAAENVKAVSPDGNNELNKLAKTFQQGSELRADLKGVARRIDFADSSMGSTAAIDRSDAFALMKAGVKSHKTNSGAVSHSGSPDKQTSSADSSANSSTSCSTDTSGANSRNSSKESSGANSPVASKTIGATAVNAEALQAKLSAVVEVKPEPTQPREIKNFSDVKSLEDAKVLCETMLNAYQLASKSISDAATLAVMQEFNIPSGKGYSRPLQDFLVMQDRAAANFGLEKNCVGLNQLLSGKRTLAFNYYQEQVASKNIDAAQKIVNDHKIPRNMGFSNKFNEFFKGAVSLDSISSEIFGVARKQQHVPSVKTIAGLGMYKPPVQPSIDISGNISLGKQHQPTNYSQEAGVGVQQPSIDVSARYSALVHN